MTRLCGQHRTRSVRPGERIAGVWTVFVILTQKLDKVFNIPHIMDTWMKARPLILLTQTDAIALFVWIALTRNNGRVMALVLNVCFTSQCPPPDSPPPSNTRLCPLQLQSGCMWGFQRLQSAVASVTYRNWETNRKGLQSQFITALWAVLWSGTRVRSVEGVTGEGWKTDTLQLTPLTMNTSVCSWFLFPWSIFLVKYYQNDEIKEDNMGKALICRGKLQRNETIVAK
jgi:hypothetical protein